MGLSAPLMAAGSRQRKNLTWLAGLVTLLMVVMPVGQPMPAVPGADTIQSGGAHSPSYVIFTRFGMLTEDDLEAEYQDFTIVRQVCCEGPRGTNDSVISFLWTERLHRPPIH